MTKLQIVSSILQSISALVLIGLSVYYCVIGSTTQFIVFLVVGVIFLVLPARTLFKFIKEKRNKDGKDNDDEPKGFI